MEDPKQNKRTLQYALIGAAMIIALVGSFFGIKLPMPDVPDVEQPAAAGGSLTWLSELTVAGDSTFEGNVILASTEITPTAGQTITAGSGYYKINSSGAVSITLAAPTVAGQVLYLYGDDANTVTVNDTNIRSTDGNAVTIGQYDIVQWISNGTHWVHVAKSADS
jgi:hypothetical protein